MATEELPNVCIPMHLDAFVLSPALCDESKRSKIAPFTQPNYTALRLDGQFLKHDLLDHIDFHSSQPATRNPRIADIGAASPGNLKLHRLGVHLSWSLPRFYRTAIASGRGTISNGKDPSQPVFRQIPNRWLITRRLKNMSDAPIDFPEYQSWVVESDVVQNIKTISAEADLESDVSPFVSYKGDSNDPDVLNAQTEVFLGQKFDLRDYPSPQKRDYLRNGLTIMSSSNSLFADFALHNCNVLSIIDNFAYKRSTNDSNPRDERCSYLAKALCDYYVVGWHHDPEVDPFNMGVGTKDVDLTTRLRNLMLKLSPSEASDLGKLEYERMEPLSIGTTPLDAILTFLEAHQSDSEEENIFGPGGSGLCNKVVELAQLLYAAADGYDARVQAQDLIAQQNFSRSEGGSHWTLATADQARSGKPKTPTAEEKGKLQELNEKQLQLDASMRKLRALRWELFAEWFKFKSEFLPQVGRQKLFDMYKRRVNAILDMIKGHDSSGGPVIGLLTQIKSLREDIENIQRDVDCKVSADEPFRIRLDPTLCIAGLDSGWPVDVMEMLQVRLDSELTNDDSQAKAIFGSLSNPITNTHGLQSTAKKILAESLSRSNSKAQNGTSGLVNITGFQSWNSTNPFVPLIIEWEAIYYHIRKESWDVQLRPSPVGHPHPQFRYVPGSKPLLSDPSNSTNQQDFRTLSGRVPVLPQPLFNLQDVVLQVLDSNSPEIPVDIDRDTLKKQLQQIKIISAPLTGIMSHLLTRCEGAHVKPNVRTQGEVVIPLAAANASDINMGIENLALVDSESTLTPYGSLMSFGKDRYPQNPFKPVTHGQMLLTKLNIVDKFGQAICLPYSNRRRVHETNPPDAGIYPCLSDYLSPDILKTSPDSAIGFLNTVFPTPETQERQWPVCQFIQLTPSINQDARINAAFLIQDTISSQMQTYSPWRETTDFESPIWGWLVINYANNGLQFFLGDGTFYREVRRGGVLGAHVSTKWLPYDPPSKGLEPTDAGTQQLDELLKQLSHEVDQDGEYLQAFFNMINRSIQNMPFPPSSYAGYANAIVGKPLALINVGWSIELAEPPIKPQFDSLEERPNDWKDELLRYNFELKVGDHERNFDGVVGYFHSANSTSPTPGVSQTNFDTLYTYFPPTKPHSKFKELKDEYPTLNPYYIDPEPSITPNMTSAKNSKYFVTSMLMDPYTAIHGYSPILPTKSLTIPPWTIQTAMDKMHAFFRLGPSLFTVDVPTTYEQAVKPKDDGSKWGVRLPLSGQKGTWTWLQPYAQEGWGEDGNEKVAKFAQLDVVEDQGERKWESSPYTFLEGYLQLMGRLDNQGGRIQ
ncbi:hypothetical protein CC78DRAFT_557805 [Lojkania enalia]|uniref:Uncharacterized protein n=1 Tax=Lojkania enalia TaxID=147567 RepID=A0A9P4TQ76_9PLEO|nr:hypothetical protein CC78DRAFT_557805 [Didymosphaeria enalia]